MPGVTRTLTFTVDDQGNFTYSKTPSNIPPEDDLDTFTYGRTDKVRFQTQAGPFTVRLRFQPNSGPGTPLPWANADTEAIASAQAPEGPSRMFRTPVKVVATPNPGSPTPIATYTYEIDGTNAETGAAFSDDSAQGDFES